MKPSSILKSSWKYYAMEALGLGIFMISACFFYAMLYSPLSPLYAVLVNSLVKLAIMGLSMGGTALFIFFSRFTRPSGSHINPAVTLAFLALGRISIKDALFYILFQFLGGTLAVYLMALLMGPLLTGEPVHYGVTVPGKYGSGAAFFMEYIIAFTMMSVILYSQENFHLKKYTPFFAAGLVCLNVMVAGPVSGFGMNPARSFASAFPSHIWTDFWIYLWVPPAAMLSAAGVFELTRSK